ncbi:MAG TPA: hypothetical protein VFH06_05125 [Candidatus Saccharimonadales bacterium]|nr:hypothetical protein [Candidatus Saccharimonadales bacterium]
MGTSKRNVLMVCVAAITTLVVTACGGNPQPAPPIPSTVQAISQEPVPSKGERVVSFAVPSEASGALLQEYSIVVGASTLVCTTQSPLELSLTEPTKGYSGEITVQKFNNGLVRINWDSTAVRSIIVNKQRWAPIDTSSAPPLATNLRPNDWGGEITSITGCNWGM